MIRTIARGYHATLMVVGTSRFFLFADFMFLYDYLISPFFNNKPRPKLRFELAVIAGILALSALVSPDPMDGLQTAFRVMLLGTMLPVYVYGFHYKKMLGFTLGLLAIFAIYQTTVMTRSVGIHMNASMLGQTALVFMPIYWIEIGLAAAILLAVSVARSPLIVLLVFGVMIRQRYYMILIVFTVAMFIVFGSISTPERLGISGMFSSFEDRSETITGLSESDVTEKYSENPKLCGEFREIEYKQFGYGFHGFCESTGQPRPHNIYVLSFYELGVLFLPFWAAIFYAARRLSLVQILPLLILGLVTDELFGRPEGVYLIASWVISIQLLRTRKSPVETLAIPYDYNCAEIYYSSDYERV